MTEFLQSGGPRALVAALLQTVWFGAATALLLALVLRWLPANRPNLRYALALLALVLTLTPREPPGGGGKKACSGESRAILPRRR